MADLNYKSLSFINGIYNSIHKHEKNLFPFYVFSEHMEDSFVHIKESILMKLNLHLTV